MSRAKKIFLIVSIILVVVLGLLFFVRPCPEYYHVGRDLPLMKADGRIIEPRRHLIQEITRWYAERFCPRSVEILFVEKAFAQSADSDLLNLKTNFPSLASSYEKINVFDAWQAINSRRLQFGLINIGMIDSGIDVLDGPHPEFLGVNFGHSDPFSLRDRSAELGGSKSGHGTKVAGIIGANNVLGTGGTLPTGSSQMNGVVSGVKNLNYILESRSKQFIPLIKFGAILNTLSSQSIVNLSLRQTDCLVLGVLCIKSEDFRVATNYYKEGIEKHPDKTFVISAGNDNIDANKSVPSNIDLPNTIIVGATDLNDQRAGFSNFGAGVNISAPGVDVYASAIRGKGNFPMTGPEANNYVTNFSGTSASAPLVTGVAGLIKAIKPDLAPAQIKDILIRNADPITTDKPIGGRLNALKAVCDPLVLNCAPTPTPTPTPSQFVQLTNTLSPAQNLPPNVSKSGNKVAFLSNANIAGLNPAGEFSLFTMNSDGTGIVRVGPNLAFLPDSEFRPSLSSDGSKIAFVARTSVFEPSAAFISNSDGTGIRRLSPPDRNVERVVMSSDGSRIVYNVFPAFPAKPQIFIVNFDGSSEKMLVEGTGTSTTLQLSSSAISDDGSKIVFSFLRSLSIPSVPEDFVWKVGIINTDGTGFVKIVPDIGNYSIEPPAMSGDGSRIAFTVITYPTSLFVVNSDGSNLHLLLTGHDPFQGGLKFTTDGSKIALSFLANIFIVNVNDPSSRKQITDNPSFYSISPYVNGDGTIIVFRSNANFTGQNQDGNLEIFLTNVR